jgi:thioredoxin reductase (NADPH)
MTIIGGGPAGLAAAFRAGMHEASARIIEIAPHLGGQVAALYPEKHVYDVFGLPKILARELSNNLISQASQFWPEVRLSEMAQELKHRDDGFIQVTTDRTTYLSRAVIITGGIGIITPRKLDTEGGDQLEGRGIYYSVQQKDFFWDKQIVIIGGGDSALDWVLNLADVARQITLVHRSDEFEGHPASVRQVHRLAAANRRIHIYTSHVVDQIHGTDRLEAVTIKSWKGTQRTIQADALLPMIGFKINLGPLERWGLKLVNKKQIAVNSLMQTNLPGIFAAGDIADYPGKIKLIATGFAEAAVAVKSALEYIHPERKVRVPFSSISGIPTQTRSVSAGEPPAERSRAVSSEAGVISMRVAT